MSPLTTTTLDCLQWCLAENKNLILAYPEPAVRSLTLMAYLATAVSDKASIIFTRDVSGIHSAVKQHTRTYSLLEDANRRTFLYKLSPIGELAVRSSRVELDLAVDLSRVKNRYYRKKYEEALQKSFHKSPKVIAISSESYSEIVDFLDAVKLEGRVLGRRVALKIGSIFFENLDRIVNSSYSCRSFLDWIRLQFEDDGMFFFGHFANPHNPYISHLAQETNSVVLHYGNSLILNNQHLLEPSFLADLGSKNILRRRKGRTMSMVLLDSPIVWTGRKPPKIVSPPVESMNIDSIVPSLRRAGHAIMEKGGRDLKYLIGPLVKLVRRMPRLSVHPHRLKLRFRFESGEWRTLGLDHYLDLALQRVSDMREGGTKNRTAPFLREFKTLVDELNKTAQFGNIGRWERKGKPWRVLEFVSDWSHQNEDRTLIVAVGDYEERRLLSNDIRERIRPESVEVRLIDNLAMSIVFPRDKDLLLPFPLSTKNFSEYLKPYNQIYVMVYDGHQAELAREHVELVQQADLESELLSINHLSRTFQSMGLNPEKHPFYNTILKKEETAERILPDIQLEPETLEEREEDVDPLERRILKLLERHEEFPLSKEDNDWEEDYESIDVPVEDEEDIAGEKVVLRLRSIDTDRIKELSIRPHKSIIALEGEGPGSKILELAAEDLRKGMVVVIPFGETRRDMTDIVVELFSEDKDIDTELLSYWKERLCDFRSQNRMSYRGLYNAYRNLAEEEGLVPRKYMTVLYWTKEWRIAPQRTEDLVVIGRMVEDSFLVENAENTSEDAQKMRSLRSWIGQLMNKVIREVLVEGSAVRERSYEEATLANMVKQSLFEVTSKEAVNGQ